MGVKLVNGKWVDEDTGLEVNPSTHPAFGMGDFSAPPPPEMDRITIENYLKPIGRRMGPTYNVGYGQGVGISPLTDADKSKLAYQAIVKERQKSGLYNEVQLADFIRASEKVTQRSAAELEKQRGEQFKRNRVEAVTKKLVNEGRDPTVAQKIAQASVEGKMQVPTAETLGTELPAKLQEVIRAAAPASPTGGFIPGPGPGPHKSLAQAAALAQTPQAAAAVEAPKAPVAEEKVDLDYFKRKQLEKDFIESGKTPEQAAKMAEQFMGLQKQKATEAEAKGKEQEKKGARLRAAKSISQGLGKVGYGMAGVGGYRGKAPEFETPEIDEAIGKQEQQVSPSARSMIQNVFGTEIPEDFTWAQLKQLLPQVGGLLESKERAQYAAEARKGMVTEQKGKEFRTSIGNVPKEITNDPTIKNLDKSLLALSNARRNIEQGGPSALGMSLGNMSKSVGSEVGVLTEKDIERVKGYIGIPGMANKVIEFFTGNYPEGKQEEWRDVLINSEGALKALKEGRIRDRANAWTIANRERIRNAGASEGETEERVLEMFGLKREGMGSPQATGAPGNVQYQPGQQIIGPDGKTYKVKSVGANGTIEVE